MDNNEKNIGMEQVAEETLNDTTEAAAEVAAEPAGITAEQAIELMNEDSSEDDKGLNKVMAILGIIILILAIPVSYFTAHGFGSKDIFEVAPKDFAGNYGSTLPEGFTLSEELENNPMINNYLQLNIESESGEAVTGCAVMFATLDETQPCINMALVTDNSLSKEQFESLAKWYLEIAAPKADEGFATSCAEVYASGSMGYDGLTLEDREVSFIYQPDAIMNNGIIAVAKIEAEGQEVEEGQAA